MTRASILVIGAGPAGLMAAQTAARAGADVALFEKLPQAGDLGHPCSAVIAPVPGFVRGERREGGLYFHEIDLALPAPLITGMPTVQRYVSAGGFAFQAVFPDRDDFPIAAIDKPALLRMLARRAVAAGAKLHFGTPVKGLLGENRIVGVRTAAGEFFGDVVISAEGASRQFTEEAGLYEGSATPRRYAFIVSETLDAPAAGQAGQISTLGKRYTSVPTPSFGTVVIPAPGRAEVYFSVFADEPHVYTEESLWHYLEEYKSRDPRVSALLAGAQPVRRAGTRMVLRGTPKHVVRDGFIGVGDSVGPGGHVGIVPCLYLGWQAARKAVEAARIGDVSRTNLEVYERLCHRPILRGLDTEYRIIISLAHMHDEELDRICLTLSRLNLAPFFFGDWKPIMAETLRWIVTSPHRILCNWRLLRRLMRGETG